MVNLLLAFPGFQGNPAIKEEPRVPCGKFSLGFSRLFQAFQETPESRKNQDVPEIIPVRSSGLFFAHKEKPGKRENFLLIFPGFSWLFQAFQETPESRKSQGVPAIILVRSSGLFCT